MNKVLSLASLSESGMAWTPSQCVSACLNELERGEAKATRALVILLDDSRRDDGSRRFDLHYFQSQMNGMELMGLLAAVTQMVAKRMGVG